MSKTQDFLNYVKAADRPSLIGDAAYLIEEALSSEVVSNGMTHSADLIVELRRLKEMLKLAASAVEEQLGIRDEELYDEMLAQEMPNFTRAGQTFFLTNKTYVTRAEGIDLDSPALVEWLERHGRGDLALRKVNAQSLGAAIREMMKTDDGNYDPSLLPDDFEQYVKVSETPTVGVRAGRSI